MAGMRVLVVEDDQALEHCVARNLRARGCSVRSAATVEDAMAVLRQEGQELVLLDIDLPDGSGWEIARMLRQDGAATSIVVMSAMRPNARLTAELRIDGILEKPFPMESLLRLVLPHRGSDASRQADMPEPHA
jgi:DNA-binding response OmpR family regulator